MKGAFMIGQFAAALTAGVVLTVGLPASAVAQPDSANLVAVDVAPPPNPNLVSPVTPVHVTTPDNWQLTVYGDKETSEPVAPLTTAVTSREYVVGGTFSGTAEGAGETTLTGGTLEAGYRIGCGITLDNVDLIGTAGIVPEVGFGAGLVPNIAFPTVLGTVRVFLKPGMVNIVPVAKKAFKGNGGRVNISGFRIKIDGCAGQSFIQSYATLGVSTDNTEDVATYLGTVKVV